MEEKEEKRKKKKKLQVQPTFSDTENKTYTRNGF